MLKNMPEKTLCETTCAGCEGSFAPGRCKGVTIPLSAGGLWSAQMLAVELPALLLFDRSGAGVGAPSLC